MASTSEISTTSIIKSDRVGRSRYSASYKAEVVAAYEQCGMSGPAFAKQCGIKYPTFASWVSKAKTRAKGEPAEPAENPSQRFVLAEFSAPGSGTALKVELPGGAIAHISSPDQTGLLAALIKTLA